MKEAAEQRVIAELLEGSEVLRQTAYALSAEIVNVAGHIITTLHTGGKVMVCGNGGSAAVLALALATGADMEMAARLANYAAGIVVGKVGTASMTVKELGGAQEIGDQ